LPNGRFRSSLQYSACSEDLDAELTALALGEGDQVLAIAGGGGRCLGLLTANPRQVVAVDFNMHQCRLVELKKAAFQTLSYQDLLIFFGLAGDPAQRRGHWPTVAQALRPETRSYWEAQRGALGRGIVYEGQLERYLRFCSHILRHATGSDPAGLFACSSLVEQTRLWEEWRQSRRVQALLRLGTSPWVFRILLGNPGWRDAHKTPADGTNDIMARMHRFATNHLLRDSHLLQLVLTGRYIDGCTLPHYLRPECYDAIRARADRLTVVHTGIEGALRKVPAGTYNRISLSNVPAFLHNPALDELWEALATRMAPGDRLVFRQFLVPRSVPAAWRETLCERQDLSAHANTCDKSIMYDLVVLERQAAAQGGRRQGAAMDNTNEASLAAPASPDTSPKSSHDAATTAPPQSGTSTPQRTSKAPPSPDAPLKCLLVQPPFPAHSFWNYTEACEILGAKTPAPPLGLVTVAAILPQHWEFRLIDLNCDPLTDELWDWADLVGVSGMLPQQPGILAVIAKAKATGKFIAVGGPDASSQPDLYSDADVIVVGEGEDAIPLWLDSWRRGEPRGRFHVDKKPDVTKSPIPRYDLLRFVDYNQIGLQYSRGCPFRCEFCDIIELYGRIPRTKTPEQVVAELERLWQLGYRGNVDMVDDNFVGNKRNVRKMLPALVEWQRRRHHPFFFTTEASMNLADDVKLLELMQAADFRIIFMGIETPDPDLLLMTQKSQNTMRPIVERVHKLYHYGMAVTAGFIMGFDNEKPGTDQVMIRCIDDTAICMAMVGLLVALPNTQLTRRLLAEGRLISATTGERVSKDQATNYSISLHDKLATDQMIAGLNFAPTRDTAEILHEYRNVIQTIYAPRPYMDRVLKSARLLRTKSTHLPPVSLLWRQLRGLVRLSIKMTREPTTRWLYWRNFFLLLPLGPGRFDMAMRLTGIYVHFQKQMDHVLRSIDARLANPKVLAKGEPRLTPPSGQEKQEKKVS